jgi:hypothetical protein
VQILNYDYLQLLVDWLYEHKNHIHYLYVYVIVDKLMQIHIVDIDQ